MMRAYDETLVYKAQITLARMFDYAVNDFHMDLEQFYFAFICSGVANAFEHGDSRTVAGKSGTELAFDIITEIYPDVQLPKPSMKLDRSPEYWLGYSLAYYQWYKNIPFHRITQEINVKSIIDLYSIYHEMDIMQFVDYLDNARQLSMKEQQIKRLRKYAELSQRQLAERSGIPIRTIQQYEQGQKNINKASFETIMALAHALNCVPESLYEYII